MKTLLVTSPHMHGPDVKQMQALLAGVGLLKQKDVDGDFGPVTGSACVAVKKRLGYPLAACQPTAGDTLVAYLTGKKELPPSYKIRRAQRSGHPDATPGTPTSAEKEAAARAVRALAALRRKLGTKESPPDSNQCWATAWYGMTGPWCAMSASWAYAEAGSKAFVRGRTYSYVPNIVGDARSHRNGLSVTSNPRPGDLVCYDWPGESKGTADHVGLFEKWIDETAGTFYAIEGNTAVGNDSNGGEVMRRDRSRALVQAFVRVST